MRIQKVTMSGPGGVKHPERVAFRVDDGWVIPQPFSDPPPEMTIVFDGPDGEDKLSSVCRFMGDEKTIAWGGLKDA